MQPLKTPTRRISTIAGASVGALFAALAVCQPAAAHHSFAMFDLTKQVAVTGTIKEFQWTNPHIWIQVMVPENGTPVEYSIEGTGPNGLIRHGWTRNTLKPGDQVSLIIHPLKKGGKGGSFVQVTLPDGKVMTA